MLSIAIVDTFSTSIILNNYSITTQPLVSFCDIEIGTDIKRNMELTIAAFVNFITASVSRCLCSRLVVSFVNLLAIAAVHRNYAIVPL